MLTPPLLRDHREPRRWDRIWESPPGFFLPNCTCCGGGAVQAYYAAGGVKFGTPSVRQTNNYKWDGGWTSKTAITSARDSVAASTPSSSGSGYVYGGVTNTTFSISECLGYTPDAWTTETSMPTGSTYAQGVAVGGNCYSVGGQNSLGVAQTYNYQYNPGGNSWATKTAVTTARNNSAGGYISSKFYNVCGDNTSFAQTSQNYEYDPSGNSWATKTSYSAGIADDQVGWSLSGTLYIQLGNGTGGGKIQKTYIVDTWSAGTNPSAATTQDDSNGYADDGASQIGFFTGGEISLTQSSTQHFDFVPTTWTSRTALPTPTETLGAFLA